MNDKLLSFLSLCKKAGRLTLGFDVVKEAVATGQASLVLCASDLSPKSRKEIGLVCSKYSMTLCELSATMDDIWYLVGKRAGIMAVCDRGMAGKLRQMIEKSDEEVSKLSTAKQGGNAQ